MSIKEDAAMRCSCRNCTTYMIQANDLTLGCVCPQCGERCTACLGTNTVLSPGQIRDLYANAPAPTLRPTPEEDEGELLWEEDPDDYRRGW